MVKIPSKKLHAETREKFSWVLDGPENERRDRGPRSVCVPLPVQ